MGNLLRGTRVCLERLQEHHINQYLQMFSPKVRALLRVKAVVSERWWAEGAFQEAIALATTEYFSGSSHETLSARVDCTNQ